MRTLVLILMIALLPLRMWAAEGMAVGMALGEAAVAAGGSESMPVDCPMMAKTSAPSGSEDEPPHAAPDCQACHLCAASASLPEVAFEPGATPVGPPFASLPAYASAHLARDLRPPIS